MTARGVEPSLSPSMDIQVSSNFERLLFELLGRDPAATAGLMQEFRRTGRMPVPDEAWRSASGLFQGLALDDASTAAAIRLIHDTTGYLADPHTAIGIAAAEAARLPRPAPVIAMATAHPAKFPDAVEKATGIRPSLPPRLAHLMSAPERFTRAPNDLAAVETLIRAFVKRNDAHSNDPWGTAA